MSQHQTKFSPGGQVTAPTDEPQPGSRVSLVPTEHAAPALAARLATWMASPGGLAVTAEVVAEPSAVELLSGTGVWANFRTDNGTQLLVAALARQPHGRRDTLELTGVAMLARELRRDAIRAGLREEVRLVVGDVEHFATTLDLSSGGCRVQVADPEAFGVGQQVDVRLELSVGGELLAPGQVVRNDVVAHELAVRFVDLDETDEAALDALVFGAIAGART